MNSSDGGSAAAIEPSNCTSRWAPVFQFSCAAYTCGTTPRSLLAGAMFASVRSVLASGVLLMCAARTTLAFVSQNAVLASATTRRATAVPAVSMHSPLQRVWDLVQDGSAAELDNVEQLMMEVDTETFTQATAWKKSYTSLRCVIAEVRDQISISVLVLPREYAGGRISRTSILCFVVIHVSCRIHAIPDHRTRPTAAMAINFAKLFSCSSRSLFRP